MKLSLVIIPFVLATSLAIANAQNNTSPSPPPPAPTTPPPPAPDSSWTPVADVNDPTIQQVGQFAVRIYALSTGQVRMSFLNVVSGETQPYNGGYNYRLVITVSGGKKAQYDAFVWASLGPCRGSSSHSRPTTKHIATMSWKFVSIISS
ncbi:hypothetical protein PR202_ga26893 [Eleusine coracana subsp. coracana]|uniref:Cystatin domain-containing protein n=1 Tax=Eleusine coracana subsp. coracana TaxID=191504 RepID=A0AAV5DFA6_ELECO|nr:hypothetical protein QOZ80_3AG0235500 [Eleusine coracana subsp. coracana]GJN08932.1 hypothetical protein PR202_ga26893 [Eleusine coracana subsp. coracana]